MATSLRCTRPAMFIENIFSGRYRHAEEMRALGAQIVLRGPMALVTGVETLHGASMKSPDLRGGAALVAAALGAEGESTVTDAGHHPARLRIAGRDAALARSIGLARESIEQHHTKGAEHGIGNGIQSAQ